MVSNLSIGALNNGWLVCLNVIISEFNTANPSHTVAALPNGIINGNWIVATNYLITELNTQLVALGNTTIPALTNSDINNGWQFAIRTLVTHLNSSVPNLPYILQNATFNSGVLHWTGGTVSTGGNTFKGYYLEYPQVPDGEVMTFTVPDLVGSINIAMIMLANSPVSPSGSTGEVIATMLRADGSSSLTIQSVDPISTPTLATGDIVKAQRSGNHLIISVNNTVLGNTSDVVGADASYMYIIVSQGGSDDLVPDVVATVS